MMNNVNKNDIENIKISVQQKFAEIRAALYMREKLLLRQADVITSHQQHHLQQQACNVLGKDGKYSGKETTSIQNNNGSQVKFLAEREDELLAVIRTFGRFQLDNMNLTLQDVYLKNEDYIAPDSDHETMYKCLELKQQQQQQQQQQLSTENYLCVDEDDDDMPKTIIVDFSRNKSLIEHNTKNMNESIINITLQEAKELIRKAKARRETPIPPLNLEELDDELESSIADAVSALSHETASQPSEPITINNNNKNNNNNNNNNNINNNSKSSQTTAQGKLRSSNKRFKPKITINNCNGTINLRNISNLTINCANEDSISAQIPLGTPTHHVGEQGEKLKNVNGNEKDRLKSDRMPNTRKTSSQSEDTQQSKPKENSSHFTNNNNNNNNNKSEISVADDKIGYQDAACGNQKTLIETATADSCTLTTNSSSGDTTPTSVGVTSDSSSNCCSEQNSSSQNEKDLMGHEHNRANYDENNSVSQQPTSTTTAIGTTSVAYPYGFVEYDDEDTHFGHSAATCDFYNRLLNEIKNTLKTKQQYQQEYAAHLLYADDKENSNSHGSENAISVESDAEKLKGSSEELQSAVAAGSTGANTSACDALQSATVRSVTSEMDIDMGSGTLTTPRTLTSTTANETRTSRSTQAGKRLILKNFENLRIILEASSSDEESFHPVQIEQWLAEIISETDLEPMQSSEILEHSKIDNESTN